MRKKIGHGIFMWTATERRTNRYGSFYLAAETYDGGAKANPELSVDSATDTGRHRVVAVVREARQSGHCGDLFLRIAPSTPNVGDEIDLGVALLGYEHDRDAEGMVVVMLPEDARDDLWIDPRQLYRLHDQTVDIYIEPTNEPCSPAPVLRAEPGGAKAVGDGGVQCKNAPLPARLPPKVTRLGDGMFMLGFDYEPGERIDLD